jgi:hypothetical protein
MQEQKRLTVRMSKELSGCRIVQFPQSASQASSAGQQRRGELHIRKRECHLRSPFNISFEMFTENRR